MNLNQQIKPFLADGIPEYNRKFNEVIAAINYLMKMRVVNGKPVRDSDQGPVIDLAVAEGAAEPWLTDPNGNPAGWRALITLDPDAVHVDQEFVWCGPVLTTLTPPWMTDPDGVQAQWVQHQVCVNGQVVNKWFWGTP